MVGYGGTSGCIGVTLPSGRVGGRGELSTQVSLWSGLLLPGDLHTHHSPTRPPRLLSEHPLLLSLSCLFTPPATPPSVGAQPLAPPAPVHPCVFPFALLFRALKSADSLLLAPHHPVPPPAPPWASSAAALGGGMLVRRWGERGRADQEQSEERGPPRPHACGRSLSGWLPFCPVSSDENWGGVGGGQEGRWCWNQSNEAGGEFEETGWSWALGKRAGGVWGLGIKRFVLEEAETGDREELPGS